MIFHVREIAGISANAFTSCEGFCFSLGNSTDVTNSFLKQFYLLFYIPFPSFCNCFLQSVSIMDFAGHLHEIC